MKQIPRSETKRRFESRGRWLTIGLCVGVIVVGILGAMGTNPQWTEDLKIGGGYGDTDGGTDLDHNGNAQFDGAVQVDGNLNVTGTATIGTISTHVEALGTSGAAGTAPVSGGAGTLSMMDVLQPGEVNTEAEFEALLFSVFTPLDGALDDDDLTDNTSDQLSDVNDAAKADGYVRAWNAATSKWICVPNSAASSLHNLSDVVIAGQASGHILVTQADNTTMQNTAMSGDATIAADGTVTVADDSHAHVIGDIDSFSASSFNARCSDGALDDDDLTDNTSDQLSDVNDAAKADGYVRKWDAATSKWICAADSTSVSDVTLADDENIEFGAAYRMRNNSSTVKLEIVDADGNIALNFQDLGTSFVLRTGGNTGPKLMTESSYVEDMSTALAWGYGVVSDGSGNLVGSRLIRSVDIDSENELEGWLTDAGDIYTDLDGNLDDWSGEYTSTVFTSVSSNALDVGTYQIYGYNYTSDVIIKTLSNTVLNKVIIISNAPASVGTVTIESGTGNITTATGNSAVLEPGDSIAVKCGESSAAELWRSTPSVYEAIVLTAAGAIPTTSNAASAPALLSSDVWSMSFDANTDQNAVWMTPMPSDYAGGTFRVTFYYSLASDWADAADKVNWAIKGVSLANSDALSTAYGTAVEAADVWATGETTDEMLSVSTSTNLTIAGSPAAGEFVRFCVYRDADDAIDDTCTAGARLHSVKLEYVAEKE